MRAPCRPLLLIIALLGVRLAEAAPPSERLLEEVAAVVERRPLLLSELELEARLQRVREGRAAAFGDPVSQDELRTALDRLLTQLVVYLEAERLQLFEPSPAELAQAREQLRTALGGSASVRVLVEAGQEPGALDDAVRREVRVRRYLEGRFRLAARPRDSELRRWWKEHPEEWAGRSFNEAAPALRQRLAAQRFGSLTAAFIADLRRRAAVEVIHDFDHPGGGLPTSGLSESVQEGGGR